MRNIKVIYYRCIQHFHRLDKHIIITRNNTDFETATYLFTIKKNKKNVRHILVLII